MNHEPGFHLSCDEYLSEGWGPPLPDTIITLTPAQAQRLINTYCYVTEPEPDAVERLTRSALSLYHTPRGNLVEFECDVYGEPVSWLSLDEIDARVYGG